jgi:hypothetical protein
VTDRAAELGAPPIVIHDGARYNHLHWLIDGIPQPAGQATIEIMMDADHTATAVYGIQRWTLSVQSSLVSGISVTGDATGQTPYDQAFDDQTPVTLINATPMLFHGGHLYRPCAKIS